MVVAQNKEESLSLALVCPLSSPPPPPSMKSAVVVLAVLALFGAAAARNERRRAFTDFVSTYNKVYENEEVGKAREAKHPKKNERERERESACFFLLRRRPPSAWASSSATLTRSTATTLSQTLASTWV